MFGLYLHCGWSGTTGCLAGRPAGRLVYDTSMINLSAELVHIRLVNDPDYAYFLVSQAFFADLLLTVSK
jgi:hypothetical protein